MFNAILWIARSGAARRDLPKERYRSWSYKNQLHQE